MTSNFFIKLQGIEIHATNGVILTDNSLVLQRVQKNATGDYTCAAVNSEGKGSSSAITLNVRCKYHYKNVLNCSFCKGFILFL